MKEILNLVLVLAILAPQEFESYMGLGSTCVGYGCSSLGHIVWEGLQNLRGHLWVQAVILGQRPPWQWDGEKTVLLVSLCDGRSSWIQLHNP